MHLGGHFNTVWVSTHLRTICNDSIEFDYIGMIELRHGSCLLQELDFAGLIRRIRENLDGHIQLFASKNPFSFANGPKFTRSQNTKLSGEDRESQTAVCERFIEWFTWCVSWGWTLFSVSGAVGRAHLLSQLDYSIGLYFHHSVFYHTFQSVYITKQLLYCLSWHNSIILSQGPHISYVWPHWYVI